MCIGHPWELISIVKAMVTKKKYIDFITIDGAEGGTGAAPAEFTDHLGSPLKDAIIFDDKALIGSNLRNRVKIGVSGKIVTAFDMAHVLGADWINMARPFMFAIGCIQCRSCHTGERPTGIATMDLFVTERLTLRTDQIGLLIFIKIHYLFSRSYLSLSELTIPQS